MDRAKQELEKEIEELKAQRIRYKACRECAYYGTDDYIQDGSRIYLHWCAKKGQRTVSDGYCDRWADIKIREIPARW